MKKLIVAISAALTLPAGAHAADYVGLTVASTGIAPGWTLSATHTSAAFYRGDEIFALTLRRTFLGNRGEEQHALRAHPKQPLISFDGRTGRWQTKGRLGGVAAIDMRITATGEPSPTKDAWGCEGAFVRVPVRLQGSFALRTGTRFFKTIRRTSLSGFVTYEDGAVSCERPPPPTCAASASLHGGDARASVLASRRHIGLSFSERAAGSPASVVWYHVMSLAGYDALTGTLPTIGVLAPSAGTIRGSAQFVGQETTESSFGACRVTRTSGTATGSFRTTFVGWGARTLRLSPAVPASYSQTSEY